MARNLLQQEPGRDGRHARATGIPNIAAKQPKRHNRVSLYTVTPSAGDTFMIAVVGREKWTLDQLRKAGATGCTPIDNPAPRWSAYVHDLRQVGVEIETLHEPHDGDFPGHHGRYVLRCDVRPVLEGGAT